VLKRVPLAFAGDPFQTLNPTGFDWGSLQANYHEKIVSGLDKSSMGKLEFNYQELSYNYRSGKFIVGLCNLLQLLRGILFDAKDLRPQHTWFDADSSMPAFFDVQDPLCEQKLRDQTELVIILPCQEGEEEEYVRQDKFLQGLATSEVDIRNFLSPMRSKGLEFSRVVLYKFGNECSAKYPHLFSPLLTGEAHPEDDDESLPLKYFLNRLYVAASRAKNRLIIVDDEEGIETLWNRTSLKSLDNLLKTYHHSSTLGWSVDSINYVQSGEEENWTEDRDDPLVLAEGFHATGLTERDAYKLRLAEANYLRCGQPATAKLCKAERLEIEDQFSKAGELYLELTKTSKALECFWSAGDLTAIASNTKFADTPEQRAASFFLGKHNTNESLGFLKFLLEQIKGPARLKISWDPQWKRVLDRCLESNLEDLDENNAKNLHFVMRELEKEGLSPSDRDKYAELASIAKQYGHAVQLWESRESGPPMKRVYWAAKARVSSYPDNLQWFKKTAENKLIVDEWKRNQKIPLSRNDAPIVLDALLDHGNYEDAVTVLQAHPEEEFLFRSYDEMKRRPLHAQQGAVGMLLIEKLADNGKWKEILDLFNDKNLKKPVLGVFAGVLAREVAQSRDFRQTSHEIRNAVGSLLKKLFIDSPWDGIVSMRIAGAAIENAYKIIDALEFYEGVWKKVRIPAGKIDVDYAVARWVKSKLRLAELLEEEGQRIKAGKHRSEAESVCRSRLGINKDNIPDSPEFDVDETHIVTLTSDVPSPKIDPEVRAALLDLHRIGRTPDELARIFSLPADVVEFIIAGDRQ